MSSENTNTQDSSEEELLETGGACVADIPGVKEGLLIGNFEIKKRLGKGGMGEVWLAYQESMERNVALKLLSPMFVQDEQFVKRFMKEARVYGKLEHPNIVAAHDAGQDRGLYYLAMSYVDGEDLSAWRKRENVIPEKDALHVVKKMSEALGYAWDRHKILHRDIKPANIMVDSTGEPKLMDLGISKALTEDSSMTMTGAIVGTPYYISPEQAKADKGIDFRADIYSLGATLYHVTTGHLPFKATSSMGVLTKHLMEPLPSPMEKNPSLSKPLAVLIEIMMAKSRDERQASWKEVIDDVELVLKGQYPQTPAPEHCREKYQIPADALTCSTATTAGTAPVKESTKKSNTPVIVAAAAALLIIVAVAILLFGGFLDKNTKSDPSDNNTPANFPNTANSNLNQNNSNLDRNVPPNKSESTENTVSVDKPELIAKPDTIHKTEKVPPKADVTVKPVSVKTNRTVDIDKKAEVLWKLALKASRSAIENQDGFKLAINKLELLKKNYESTKYASMALDEIAELEKAQEKAVANVFKELDIKAGKLIAARDFEGAASVYRDYRGKFDEHLEHERATSASGCRNAPRKFRKLVTGLCEQLFKQASLSEVPGDFIRSIRDLKKYYPRDCKKLDDLTMNLVKLDGLQIAERDKRVSGFDEFTKTVYNGLRKSREMKFDEAEKEFKNCGILSKDFQRLLKKEIDRYAKDELQGIVHKAGLMWSDNNLKILDQFAAKPFPKEKAKVMLDDLDKYAKKYSDATFLRQDNIAKIIATLRGNAEESMKRRSVLPKDNKSNKIYIGMEAADLFAPDEDKK